MPDDQESPELSKGARQEERERRRRRTRLALLIAVFLTMLLLGLDNAHDVRVEWLVGESDVRMIWVIVVAFGAGVLSERAYSFVRGRRRDRD